MRHAIVVVVLLGSASASATPVQAAATYLQGKQGFDGSFGGATGTEPTLTTAAALQALVAVLGTNSTSVQTARSFLSGRRPIDVELQARRLQGLDGTFLADTMTAAAFRSAALSGAGFGFYGSDPAPTLLESAQVLGFLAGDALLTSTSAPPQINLRPPAGCSQTSVICGLVSPMLQFILSMQNYPSGDGGWAYSGESSDLRMTAEIAAVLMPLRHQLNIDSQLTAAVNFIVAQQAADGHFGSATPSTGDTALAMIALVGAPATQSTAVNKAVTFLTGAQKADGSWDESELDTALAARALQAVLPTLGVTQSVAGTNGSLSLSTDSPSIDGTVTASVTITNSGDSSSTATTVVFTAVGEDGQPTITLGSASVGVIAAGGNTTVNDSLNTSGLVGPYEIVATVQPSSNGAQSSPVGSAQSQVGATASVASTYDLALTPTDIVFSLFDAGGVIDAGVVTINATIHENGTAVSTAFNVGVYRGDPIAGGTLIGESSIASVAAGGTASATVNWLVSQGNGETPLFVVADPEQVIPDVNRANNKASRAYQAPDASVDLALYSGRSLFFNPTVVPPGTSFTTSVVVFNNSAIDAYNVEVGICPNNLSVSPICPTAINIVPVVPAASSATTSFLIDSAYTQMPPGQNSMNLFVTAYVDPYQITSDPSFGNNTINTYVTVTDDFSISLGAFTPQMLPSGPQVAGTTVTLQAQATTTSFAQQHIPWTLYVGDPDFGGVPIQSGVVEVTRGSTNLYPTGVTTGPTTLFVLVLDPDNTLHNTTPRLARQSYAYSGSSTDLGIGYNDISFSPVGPAIGDTTTVAVTVHNYGDAGATSELLAYEGDPAKVSSVQLGAFPVSVAGGQTTQVSFPWTREGAQTNLYFKLVDIAPFDLKSADDSAIRNAFLEAVYSSGRVDGNNTAPYTSAPAVGDLLQTGQPVIGFGESPIGVSSAKGYLTLLQKTSANVLSTVLSRQVDWGVSAPVFVNVDGDGGPKVVFLSVTGSPTVSKFANRGNTIHVWTPSGTAVWEKSYANGPDGGPNDACMNENNMTPPGVGDVNGDGIADVVFPTSDGTIHVLDGKTGAVIWETTFPAGYACAWGGVAFPPTILDINGDGKNEVLIDVATPTNASANVLVYSSTGTLLSPTHGIFLNGSSNSLGNYMVASLTGPGGLPAMVTQSYDGNLQAVVDGGVQVWLAPIPEALSYNGTLVAADSQGDGRPLLFGASQAGTSPITGQGGPSWIASGPTSQSGYNSITARSLAAADLFGLGQPQVLLIDGQNTLTIFDGRTGLPLFIAGMQEADWAIADESGENYDLAIADVDNDGHGEIVVSNFGDGSDTVAGVGYDQNASLFIFGSDAHWKAMPNAWSGIAYHHQFNADLTLSADAYKPWTTHNTWREQFVTNATTVQPDLIITATDGGEKDIVWTPSPSDGGSVAAGAAANVIVTVHNMGGVAASSVPVSLYLGNPLDGGTFIATQTITGTLDAGGGVGSTTFSWIAWPEGWDQLTAVANAPFSDGGRAIAESNYLNNQYSTTPFVRPGAGLADISVAGANFGTTLGYAAGQPVTLQTTITNNGSADAGAFTVLFIDGAGGIGPVIGTRQVTGLKAGASTVVQVANWLPAQGVHAVTVEADPYMLIPDSNLGNNTAEITFTIGNATRPDLQITATDLSLTPSGPVEPGTTVELGCVLHNEGTATNPNTVGVKVTLDTTTTLLSATIAVALPVGSALPFTVPVSTGALATGLHTLTVTADPGNLVAEYNETNNSASISFSVGKPPASVVATTDKSSYGAGAAVVVNAALAGLTTSPDTSVQLYVDIDTAGGDLVATLANAWDIALGSGVTQTLPYNWNTGDTPPGSYVALAWLVDTSTGITASTSQAAFTISASVVDTVTVAPLLNGYQPGAGAVVATQIDDQSLNASIANATLVLQINTPGAVSFYTSTREFLNVGAGDDLQFLDSVAIPFTAAAGNYPMTATLKTQAGATLATGTGTLVVQAPTIQSEFGASLTATPPSVAINGNVTLAASLTNQTSGALNNQSVNVEVLVPATQAIVAQFPSNQNFNAGQNINVNNVWTPAAAGTYLAGVLINGTAVAHALIQVYAAGGVPPLITFTGVTDGELTNQTVTPVIHVNCPSGGACNPTATLDGLAFTSGTAVNATGTHFLSVSATDAVNHVTTVSVSFTIYTTAPRITVGGIKNNQYTNAASVAPTVTIVDPYLDPTKTVMQLNGTTFYQGMQITAEGSYVLSITAQDKAGNSSAMNVDFWIDRTKPVITITGVTNGQVTNAASLTPTITLTDLYLDNTATHITLNGSAYTSGTAITAEGTYVLVVSGADLAGNTASQTLTFYIDRTAPVITIIGVANGVTYAGAVQPTITVTDSHPKTSTITLDTVAYTSGTAITANGGHTLAVSATDQAGNTASVSDTFTITPPSAPPFFSPGVCAGSVALSNGAWIAPQVDAGGPILLNSAGNFTAANTSLVIGSCIAAGNLTFSDTADLTGTVLLGGTETLNGQSAVGAVVNEAAGFTSPCCAFNVTNALTAASTNNDNTRLPAAITSHVVTGAFAIYDGGVSFPSGAFYFSSFEVGDGGSVGIVSGAVTQLYVNGPFGVQGTFGGDSNRLGSLTVLASGNISLSAGQSGTSQGGVTIIGEYPVPGLFYSGATVNLSGSTELIGGVVANTLNVSGNASVVVPLSLTPADAGLVCQ